MVCRSARLWMDCDQSRAEGHLFHFMGLPAESDHRLHQCPHYSPLHWIMHHSRWMLWSRLHPHGVTAACGVRHGCRHELQPSFQWLCRGLGLKSARWRLLSAARTLSLPFQTSREWNTNRKTKQNLLSCITEAQKRQRILCRMSACWCSLPLPSVL